MGLFAEVVQIVPRTNLHRQPNYYALVLWPTCPTRWNQRRTLALYRCCSGTIHPLLRHQYL